MQQFLSKAPFVPGENGAQQQNKVSISMKPNSRRSSSHITDRISSSIDGHNTSISRHTHFLRYCTILTSK
uniref:Uncharacterized protein n=1 Tax=Lutzomyia longipalpis TaxID=7200 RepID=A0A1B0CEM8_LUTLO